MLAATSNATKSLVGSAPAPAAKSTETANELSHSGASRRRRPQRLLDQSIHFLSHRFILSRRRTTVSRAAGLRLTVPPTVVFHNENGCHSKARQCAV
jgi:hypothetical protein